MWINGREIKFLRAIEANCRVADMAPDKDASRIGEVFSGNYQTSQRQAARFIAALSDSYEQREKFKDNTYKPRPLTEEEAMYLDDDEFGQCFNEAWEAWTGEKPTIQTEPVEEDKSNKKKSGESEAK